MTCLLIEQTGHFSYWVRFFGKLRSLYLLILINIYLKQLYVAVANVC